jgi:glycerol uptake facilitator-like aquaporin
MYAAKERTDFPQLSAPAGEKMKAGYYELTNKWQNTLTVMLTELFSVMVFSIVVGASVTNPFPAIASPIAQGILIGGLTVCFYLWGGVHLNPMVSLAAYFHQPIQLEDQEMSILYAAETGTYRQGDVVVMTAPTKRTVSGPLSEEEINWNHLIDDAIRIRSTRNYIAGWMAAGRIIVQFIAYFIGWACVLALTADGQLKASACVVDPYNTGNWSSFNGFFAETIGTFVIVLVSVMAFTMQLPIDNVGVSVGFTNLAMILTFVQISSACFNPWRAVAANTVAGWYWTPFVPGSWWLYLVGPLVGSILAILFIYLFKWLRNIKGAGFMCVAANWKNAGILWSTCAAPAPQAAWGSNNMYGIQTPPYASV